MPSSQEPVTQLLTAIRGGSEEARAELFARLYQDLRRMARNQMRRQEPGHTLQTTALVNEACLRLLQGGGDYADRGHLLAVAARAMRQVLVDHARSKRRAKRTPPGERVPLDEMVGEYEARALDLVALDAALERLRERDERMVRLVDLRFFGGLSMKEVAGVLGMSERHAFREWETARAWLRGEIG